MKLTQMNKLSNRWEKRQFMFFPLRNSNFCIVIYKTPRDFCSIIKPKSWYNLIKYRLLQKNLLTFDIQFILFLCIYV